MDGFIIPIVSFLIPLYNCADTLEKCICSITSQFLHSINYEIVVVNDGSTDQGNRIIDDMIAKSLPIRLYNQPNHGIAYTRQRLIDLAIGKYIMFVDPDDYLVDGTLPVLLREIELTSADAVCYSFSYGNDHLFTSPHKDTVTFHTYSGSEFMQIYDFSGLVPLWRFLFRRSSITEKMEPDINIAEDLIFIIKQLPTFKKILFTDLIGYVYCVNNTSITQSKNQDAFVRRSKSYAAAACALSQMRREFDNPFPTNVMASLADVTNKFAYLSIGQCIIGGAICT